MITIPIMWVAVATAKDIKNLDLMIIGGGPAGLSAAIYAIRAGKSALVFARVLTQEQKLRQVLNENGFVSSFLRYNARQPDDPQGSLADGR